MRPTPPSPSIPGGYRGRAARRLRLASEIDTGGEPVRAGEPIGVRHDGTPVPAPGDGRVVLPNPDARVGAEWVCFAAPSTRRP